MRSGRRDEGYERAWNMTPAGRDVGCAWWWLWMKGERKANEAAKVRKNVSESRL